jgi:16S rRNA (cytidine1402-2'-O)-methyltransferase
MCGTLYLVATPIGNLEDITIRALRILKEVSLIACEDTRHTSRLLTHFGIATKRTSYHEHNEAARTREIVEHLRGGEDVALVSDAGMPLVSDPGYRLVSACRQEAIPVVPVPGASAVLAALSASGLPSDRFYFEGFLPPRAVARRRRIEELAGASITMVFYEAPHRVVDTLRDLAAILGPRPACVAREITKLHEEWLTGSLLDLLTTLGSRPQVQGEITLVVGGDTGARTAGNFPDSIAEHLRQLMESSGADHKEALKVVARQRGLSRKEAYRRLVQDSQSGRDRGQAG